MIRWQRRRHYTEIAIGTHLIPWWDGNLRAVDTVRVLWRLASWGAPSVTHNPFPGSGCYIFTCGPLWIEWPEAGHG